MTTKRDLAVIWVPGYMVKVVRVGQGCAKKVEQSAEVCVNNRFTQG